MNRIFLGLLAALMALAVPTGSASADHNVDPACDSTHDLGTDRVNVVSGSIDAADSDVWRDPETAGGFMSRKDYVVAADGPFKVTRHISFASCSQRSSCAALTAPYVCTFTAIGPGENFITVSDAGSDGEVNYHLARVVGDSDPLL